MPTARTERDVYLIRKQVQLGSLASPARQEILDALSASGPLSIADLARATARRPHALYHHMHMLLRVGLIQEVGIRRNGKSDARIYAVPARAMKIQYDLPSPAFRRGMRKTIRSMFRLAERDFTRGLELSSAVTQGPRLNLWGGRVKGRLTREQLAEVNRLMRRIVELFRSRSGGREARLHAVTLTIVPIPET